MKPVDYRNETFDGIMERLEGLRLRVLCAMRCLGGGATTREIAVAADMSILSARPRVTELVQLGLAECVGGEDVATCTGQGIGRGREGVYRAVPLSRARVEFAARQQAARTRQMALPGMET
jgi:hypothetical protein